MNTSQAFSNPFKIEREGEGRESPLLLPSLPNIRPPERTGGPHRALTLVLAVPLRATLKREASLKGRGRMPPVSMGERVLGEDPRLPPSPFHPPPREALSAARERAAKTQWALPAVPAVP